MMKTPYRITKRERSVSEMAAIKYELTRDLETGNTIIDGEHRELFKAVNAMMDACTKGQGRASIEPTIKFLLDYVNKHFAHEEELQLKSKYPGMASHKQFHADYTRKLRMLAGAIPSAGPSVADLAAINQHIAVLVSHIRTEDKRLGAFLGGK